MDWKVVVVGLSVAVAASGCVRSSSVVCDDGRLCPENSVCDDASDRCIPLDLITACEGKQAFEMCEGPGITAGICVDAVCVAAGCGNGLLDGPMSGENCDDGNTLDGDGCSADCRSNETCGNGYLDELQDEVCDDGDAQSRDGCGACELEDQIWTRVDRAADGPVGPSVRHTLGLAYDAARGRVVMFGGQPDNSAPSVLGDTWEWNGRSWELAVSRLRTPAPRDGHSLAYDSVAKHVLLFGGRGSQDALLADTWVWNGNAWTNITQQFGSPSPRWLHALAFDAGRGRVVLFGGFSVTGYSNEVWEHDGTSWTNVTPASGPLPSPRASAAIAYDPKRGRVALFGGYDDAGVLGDTWEWDGTRWTNLGVLPGAPSARREHAMAFDPVTGRIVLHGGRNSNDASSTVLTDTFEWNGSAWTSASASGPHYAHAMVSDVARRALIVFGGKPATGSNYSASTWERVDGTWRDISPTYTRPDARQMPGMAYDPARGRTVLFGGLAANGDTWEWSGAAWQNVRAANGSEPAARGGVGLVFHAATGAMTLFGGRDLSTVDRNETWRWTGSAWTNVTPASGNPPARSQHGMTYDRARGRTVLVGGRSGDTPLADMWEYDGTTWSAVTVTGDAPSARMGHGLAYDARRGRLVLFGGQEGPTGARLSDTWEFDGSTWTKAASQAFGPRARSSLMLAYDDTRERVLLFGGEPTGTGYISDTWEWDGAAWTNIATDTTPSGRRGSGFAYDSTRRSMLLFSGQTGFVNQETFTLQYAGAVPEDGCLYGIDGDSDGVIGCADPDCSGYCAPMCPVSEGTTCTSAGPRCGDGVCQVVESKRLCADDCGAAATVCGDFVCDATEAATTCPGDCR